MIPRALLAAVLVLGCAAEQNKTAPQPAATATEAPPSPAKVVPAVEDTPDQGEQVAIYDIPISYLGGDATTLAEHKDKAILVVNVASKCGLTPQYEGLEALQKKYADRGFAVIGFPCNQFGGQEPGDAAAIKSFCTSNYGVTFPMYEKVEVNGEGRHPIYEELTAIPDGSGEAGDIKWNFEKFVVAPGGSKVTRFRPQTAPDDPALVAAIEAVLPK